MEEGLYIGLISGTSVDGIDAALVSFQQNLPSLICSHLHPYPERLRQSLQSLFRPGDNEIDRMGALDNEVGIAFAAAANALLEKAGISRDAVRAIGSHGQTIRHRPDIQFPFTLQIGNPFVIAEHTGIEVIADFRRRDMAAGGQGAPLAPLFHREFIASKTETRVVLNLGGIANITLLPHDHREPVAFDTGPANGLMDAWILQQLGKSYDAEGSWAASGNPDSALLAAFLREPYFSLLPPKSTGKELFHLPWATQLADLSAFRPEQVQATFLALSCETIAQAIETVGGCDRVLACGGGVHNHALMNGLQQRMGVVVETTQVAGIEPDWVEAMAFAWFAKANVEGNALNSRPFTGARKPVVLGSKIPRS